MAVVCAMPAAIVSNLVDLPVKNRTMNWTIVTCQPYGDPMKDSTPTYAKYVYRNLLLVYVFLQTVIFHSLIQIYASFV